jgi:hypothetical protein
VADYPVWVYYPSRDEPPPWVSDFVDVIAIARGDIESKATTELPSDRGQIKEAATLNSSMVFSTGKLAERSRPGGPD